MADGVVRNITYRDDTNIKDRITLPSPVVAILDIVPSTLRLERNIPTKVKIFEVKIKTQGM
jgi:hypothetical protein